MKNLVTKQFVISADGGRIKMIIDLVESKGD